MDESSIAGLPDPGRFNTPRTEAVRRVLQHMRDHTSQADLLFLERWELRPLPGSAAALRVGQIRRANPTLAAEIRAELSRGRPLTAAERDALRR